MLKPNKQILAVTGKIKKGKIKNVNKAKNFIQSIKSNRAKSEWLAQ